MFSPETVDRDWYALNTVSKIKYILDIFRYMVSWNVFVVKVIKDAQP